MLNFAIKLFLIARVALKYKIYKLRQLPDGSAGKIGMALTDIGPAFIKFGQMLSARPDIVGIRTAKQLAEMQDKVAQFSPEEIKKIVVKELGKTPEELFAEFDYHSSAAASIAQIHKATTKNGEKIALKILRPHIKKTIQQDIDFLLKCSKLITLFFPKTRRLALVEVIKNFEHNLRLETDLSIEAAHASRLRKNIGRDRSVYVPKTYWEYTTKKIFAMEWIDGIPISDIVKIRALGLCCHKISTNLAITFFNQTYRDGFFHGDMHPGNIMVMPDCTIALLDFGIMGYLDDRTRINVARILYGFIKKDYLEIATIHFKAGYIPETESVELFTTACHSIGEPIVGKSLAEISVSKLLMQLFHITELFNMRTQIPLLLFQKNLILVEGIGSMIYPETNLWSLAEPWMRKWAKNNLSIKNKTRNRLLEINKEMKKITALLEKANVVLDHKIQGRRNIMDKKIYLLLAAAALLFIIIAATKLI